MTDASSITPRPLNVGDLMSAMDVIDKLLDALTEEEMATLLSGTQGEGVTTEKARAVGFNLFTKAFRHCRSDVFALLADVCGLTVEDMKALPADTLPRVFTAVLSEPKNSDFFSQLRDMLPGALEAKKAEG